MIGNLSNPLDSKAASNQDQLIRKSLASKRVATKYDWYASWYAAKWLWLGAHLSGLVLANKAMANSGTNTLDALVTAVKVTQ